MQHPTDHPTPPVLAEWRSRPQFQAENSQHYPSVASLDWAIRVNRLALLEADAICVINGRIHVHNERFPQTIVELGKRAAERRARAA